MGKTGENLVDGDGAAGFGGGRPSARVRRNIRHGCGGGGGAGIRKGMGGTLGGNVEHIAGLAIEPQRLWIDAGKLHPSAVLPTPPGGSDSE